MYGSMGAGSRYRLIRGYYVGSIPTAATACSHCPLVNPI